MSLTLPRTLTLTLPLTLPRVRLPLVHVAPLGAPRTHEPLRERVDHGVEGALPRLRGAHRRLALRLPLRGHRALGRQALRNVATPYAAAAAAAEPAPAAAVAAAAAAQLAPERLRGRERDGGRVGVDVRLEGGLVG